MSLAQKMRCPELLFLRFALVGVANSLFGLLIIYAIKFIGGRDALANFSGYALGMVLSYILNKNWTFSYENKGNSAILRFVSVTLVAYLSNLFMVLLLIDVININSYIAQAFGVPVYSLISYFGCKWFVFPLNEKNIGH